MTRDEDQSTEGGRTVRRRRLRKPLGLARPPRRSSTSGMGCGAPGTSTRSATCAKLAASLANRERTDETNKERIRRYILPHLPAQGAVPLDLVSRADPVAVQGALLEQRLSRARSTGRSRRCRRCCATASRSG